MLGRDGEGTAGVNALSSLFQGLRSALQWWVVLAPWESAVRVRRGKDVKVLGAGIHLRIPLLDRFFVQSTRIRISDLPIQTISTKDGAALTIKGQLAYRIIDVGRLYDTLHSAEGTLANIAQAEIADHVTSRDRAECDPASLAADVTEALKGRLLECGLNDVRVTVTDFVEVRTYRLITQDIWSNAGPALNTTREHNAQE